MLKSNTLVAGAATAALVAAGLGGAAAAQAAPTQGISATVTGAAGTSSKPKPVGVNVKLTTGKSTPGEARSVTRKSEIFLPPTFKLNGKFFRSCTEAKLEAGPSGCPSASRVGAGTAKAYAGTGPNALPVNLTVDAFNGPGGKSLLLYVSASSPVSVQSVIVAKVVNSPIAGFGKALDVDLPSNLQSTAGLPTPLEEFVTNIPQKTFTKKTKKRKRVNGKLRTVTTKKKYGFIESTGCTSGYPFGVRNTFTSGAQASGLFSAPCG